MIMSIASGEVMMDEDFFLEVGRGVCVEIRGRVRVNHMVECGYPYGYPKSSSSERNFLQGVNWITNNES